MKRNKKPIIGITLGDPCGIGPEIIAKALSDPLVNTRAYFQIIGDHKAFLPYQKKPLRNTSFINLKNFENNKIPFGKINKKCGQISLEYLDVALSLLKQKSLSALVTGPICKEAIQLTHKNFTGHTEYLANFFKTKTFDMMFVTPELKVVIATRHLPLSSISSKITTRNIYQTLLLTAQSLKKQFKISNPKIAVCGLNPHAGEGGRMGVEEKKIIIPAIRKAKQYLKNISGPFPADTVFCPFNSKKYDAIISMYHDQGLFPIKMKSFDKLVNLTIGLPIVRTSPAHGTAFDIVGKNKANPSSLCESIKLAIKLST